MLVEQTYPGLDDHRRHFDYLLGAFTDPRYITVENKPVFVIYRPYEIPDVKGVMDLWRELAIKAGLAGLHLVGEGLDAATAHEFGFDAATYSGKWKVKHTHPSSRILRRLLTIYRSSLKRPAVYPYSRVHTHLLAAGVAPMNEYPAVIPNWDTTPRLGWRGQVFASSTPEAWRRHLRDGLSKVAWKPPERRVLFVKSWNEWAEGNHLEPDQRYGRAHLDVVRQELARLQGDAGLRRNF
jgi:hypothetical protein